MPKTGGAAEGERGDFSFTRRHTIGLPDAQFVVTVSKDQLPRADQDRARGWPPCAAPYSMGDQTIVVRDPVSASGNYRPLDAKHGWVTGEPMEPLIRALAVAGAAHVGAGDFRTLGAHSGLLRSSPDFQVWSPPGQKLRDGEKVPRMAIWRQIGPARLGRIPPSHL